MSAPAPSALAGEFTQILYHVDEAEGLAVVSLNRPKYRNAISRIMTHELDAAFNRACEDPRVRVIVLRGEGGHFSSGHDIGTKEQLGDLRTRVDRSLASRTPPASTASLPDDLRTLEIAAGPSFMHETWSTYDVEMCLKWRQLPKPLLGGVKGFVVYHGWAVAASCDILLAAEDTKILGGLVEMNSLPYDLALNARKAKEMLFNRRFVLAEEAEELGLVNRVVPTGELDTELLRMAKVIGKADPFHLRMMKLTVNQAQDAAGMSASMRSALSAWDASVWHNEALEKSGAARDPKAFAPMAHAQTDEVMHYSETAALRAAAKRKSRL